MCLLCCSAGTPLGESPLKRGTPSSQSAKSNLTKETDNVAAETWPAKKRVPINGYEVIQSLHDMEMSLLDFWKLPIEVLLILDNLCTNILNMLKTELNIVKTNPKPKESPFLLNVGNEGLLAWARSVLEMLPSFKVVHTMDYVDSLKFTEDVSYKKFKHAYHAYIPKWDWGDCHIPWVLGDGACMFNSVISLMTGRGVLHCPYIAQYKYVIGAPTLRLATICREILAMPYIKSFSGASSDDMQRRVGSRCSVSSYVAEEEVAALALLCKKPIQLMSPRWGQQFCPYGVFSSGCENVDKTCTPLIIMWCKFTPNNCIFSINNYHEGGFKAADMNHFVPCFVKPNALVPRLKYMSTLKWCIVELSESCIWKCPFFCVPSARSGSTYMNVVCPIIGEVVVDGEIVSTSVVFKPIWEEVSWELLVNNGFINDGNVCEEERRASGDDGDVLTHVEFVCENHNKGEKPASKTQSVKSVPALIKDYFTVFVKKPEFLPHVHQYFEKVCSSVLYKFITVKDVNIQSVDDVIAGLPNDVYKISNDDIARYCYYWLGTKRIHVIAKLSNTLQKGMGNWANLSMSMTKNVNSSSFKKLCSTELPDVPLTVAKHYASKILQCWCKQKTIVDLQYVSPKWMPQHQLLLNEYLCQINFESARCNITNVTFDENAMPLYKLYCYGFDIQTIKDQVSLLCCSWSVEMSVMAHDCFTKYSSNTLLINQTMLDLQLAGFCNVRKQDVHRKYKVWLTHRSIDEEVVNVEDNVVHNEDWSKVVIDFRHNVKSSLPFYICKDCEEMCFKDELGDVEDMNYRCLRCVRSCLNDRVSPLSAENGCSIPEPFPDLPQLTDIESKIVALQIPYMNIVQLFAWKGGYQVALRGNVINIPNNVRDVVDTLPRLPDDLTNATLFVSLYKNVSSGFSFWSDNVRPVVVHAYMSLLCKTPLYVEQNIKYDPRRNLKAMKDVDVHVCDVVENTDDKLVEDVDVELTSSTSKFYDPYGSKLCSDFVLNEYWTADKVERLSSVHMKIEPSVNQAFVSLLCDNDSVEKCFPNIFLGQKYFQKERSQNVAIDKLHKHLLRLNDERARCDAGYVFFAMQQIQLKLAMNSIGLRMRKHQGFDNLSASEVLQQTSVDRLVKNDVAFRDLEKVVGSPDELATCKKNYRAMLRQLGHFQIFLTITSGEMYDKDVVVQLMEHDKFSHALYNGNSYLELYDCMFNGSVTQRTELKQICRDLSRKHSVLMVRLYHKKKAFIFNEILPCLLPTLEDYIANDEFGAKGLPHTHACLRLSDFPTYNNGCDKTAKDKVIQAIDKLCTCSVHGITEHQRNVQTHSHVNCMRDGSCRHRFPKYPMPFTDILEPLNAASLVGDASINIARNLNKINLFLRSLWKRSNIHAFAMPFSAMLAHLDLTFSEYIDAIRSTLKGSTVMLRRRLCEIKMNTYCKALLEVVDCNMDFQFIIDPYVVIEYICNYITKGPHGISELMKKLMEEAKLNNMNVSQYIIKKANLFFNRREVCLYQACCVVLELPMRLCTRKFVYLATCETKDRVYMVKRKDVLLDLDANDKNILCKTELHKYSCRPVGYEEHYCIDFVANYTTYMQHGVLRASKCRIPRIVRFRGYRETTDSENFYREQLLLYTNWRDELIDVKGDYTSYKEAYVAKKDLILERFKVYNKLHASRIDEIVSRVEAREDERALKDVSNNVVNEDVEQFTLMPLQFKNDVYKGLQDEGTLLPEKEFLACVRNLTYKQRLFYEHIKMSLLKPDQMLLFLTGGAGVGKSVVLLAVAQMLMRHFRRKLKIGQQDSEKPTVLIMSFTGNAAFNVGGNTVHSVFRVTVNDSQYKDVSANVLCTMKAKYGHISAVIVDEISMLSAEMLYVIHMRLCQITGNDTCFGGVHVYVVGDLFQLKPVAGSWVFQRPSTKMIGAGASLFDVWEQFQMYELLDVLRTTDLDWITCLNRIREGQHTPEDVVMVKDRILEFPHDLEDIICARHEDLDEANKIFFDCFPGVPVYVKSKDRLSMYGVDTAIDNTHAAIITGMHCKHKQFLQDSLPLKLNLPVELRHNFDTTDGLTNGAEGLVSGIERDDFGEIYKVHITFKNDKRGRNARKVSKTSYYSVKKVTKTFELKKGSKSIGVHCAREQLPLGCCHARTFHRVQGLSLMRYGIIFGPVGSIPKHMVYVALSRGRKYKGIYLKDFNEKHIKVDEDVVREMARLRTTCKVQINSVLKRDIHNLNVFVMSHNARTFNADNYKSLPDFENVDVLFCAEVGKQYVVKQMEKGEKKLNLAVSNLEKVKGQVMYVNSKFVIQHTYYITKCNVDLLFCTFTTPSGFTFTVIGIYKQIKHSVTTMVKVLDIIYATMPWKCVCCHKLCITGDFNIQTDLLNLLCVSKFNLYEISSCTPTTVYNTKIDYMFTTDNTVQACDYNLIPCDWSDHHILFFEISQATTLLEESIVNLSLTYDYVESVLLFETRVINDKIVKLARDLYVSTYNIFWSTTSMFVTRFPTMQFDSCVSLKKKWIFVVYNDWYNDIIWFNMRTCHYIRLISVPADEIPKNHVSANDYIPFFKNKNCLMPDYVVDIHVPRVMLPIITGYYIHNICVTDDICGCAPLTLLNWTKILTKVLDDVVVQVS
jgi:hypothetical protein